MPTFFYTNMVILSFKHSKLRTKNSFLCLLKNAIFDLSVFDPEATICRLLGYVPYTTNAAVRSALGYL